MSDVAHLNSSNSLPVHHISSNISFAHDLSLSLLSVNDKIIAIAVERRTLYLVLLIYGIIIILRTRNDPLRKVPGPFLARWTSLWLANQTRQGRRYKVIDQLHRQYGRFVRIAPNYVSVADTGALATLYGHGERALLKSSYYDSFVTGTPSLFATTDRKDHANKRRVLSNAFSKRSVGSLSPFLKERIEDFVTKMNELCGCEQFFDILPWLNYLAYDTISDLAFGEPIGMIDRGTDFIQVKDESGKLYEEHLGKIMDDREHAAAVQGTLSTPLRVIAKFLPDPFLVRGRQSAIGLGLLAKQCVIKRVATGAQREDILGKLIRARVKEESRTLTEQQVTELTAEAITILIAGSQTTAGSATVILHLVLTHEQVYKKLLAELNTAVGEGELPTYDRVKDLPYLQATINEGLRHHGTAAVGLPRIAPKGGIECSGQYFPGGTELSVPAWTIMHDDNIWGDPTAFRPERWLENHDLRQYLITFGLGSRTCLGKYLATMQIQLVLSTLLLCYEIEPLANQQVMTFERFMHEPLGMKVRITRRENA